MVCRAWTENVCLLCVQTLTVASLFSCMRGVCGRELTGAQTKMGTSERESGESQSPVSVCGLCERPGKRAWRRRRVNVRATC